MGHLICFVGQIFCLVLKLQDDYIYVAQTLLIILNFLFYIIPVIDALYVFKQTNLNPMTLEVSDDIEGWLQIELMFFFSWVFAVCFFLFFAFVLKFKSLVRPCEGSIDKMNEDDVSYDIWAIKGSDDFLHFFKFESYQISFYVAQMVMLIQILCLSTR